MDTIFDKYSHLLPVKYHTAFQSAEWAEFEKQHWVKIKALYEANKRKFDPMEIHGVPHIERCLIMANILFQFLGGNSSNSMNRLLSLIAVAFHDAGRTNNGSDIWESQSARLCKQYLLNIGFSTEAALRAEFMILKQEGGMQGDVLHDVDAIEITRLIGKSDFDWNQLHLLKREGVDAQEMKMLLMQLMEFAIEAQDKVIFQAGSNSDFYQTQILKSNTMATIQDLDAISIVRRGEWKLNGEGNLEFHIDNEHSTAVRERNHLYVFLLEDPKKDESEVKYVGKTIRTLEDRLKNYKAGNGQATNFRINSNINDFLHQGMKVHIYSLKDISSLQWGGYNLNLAAGLEDDLIFRWSPDWNQTKQAKGAPINDEEADYPQFEDFEWKLGPTYYNKASMNPGVGVDHLLGKEGEQVLLIFPGGESFESRIDRTANANGTARLRFSGAKSLIKSKYSEGDVVLVRVYKGGRLEVAE